MGKHDKHVTLRADVPTDDYYKAKIGNLQRRNDELQKKLDLSLAYIETLESEKMELGEIIEEKDAYIGSLKDTIVREVARR